MANTSEISALPEELLELIFSYFSENLFDGVIDEQSNPQEHCDIRHTLFTLCLVSKQCCRLAQPLLYHTIHLVGQHYPFSASTMLQKLVRTLVYQPMLTSYVVKLCVDSVYLEDKRGERGAWDVSYEDAVDSYCTVDRDDASRENLLENLRDGTFGAHTALLLAMCQDVQSMKIAFPDHEDNFTRRILYDAAGGLDPSLKSDSTALSSLKVLSLCSDADDGTLLSDFIHLFRFPELETFCGFALDCTSEGWSQCDSFASRITRMDLRECLIDAGGMKSILEACPHLQDLTARWGEALLGEYMTDFEGIGQQLNRLGKRLKNLALDIEQSHYDVGSGLGDLSQMTSLKSLSALDEVLLGHCEPTDITLPTSLEYLTVSQGVLSDDDHFWEQIRSVADRGMLHDLVAIRCTGVGEESSSIYWSKETGYRD